MLLHHYLPSSARLAPHEGAACWNGNPWKRVVAIVNTYKPNRGEASRASVNLSLVWNCFVFLFLLHFHLPLPELVHFSRSQELTQRLKSLPRVTMLSLTSLVRLRWMETMPTHCGSGWRPSPKAKDSWGSKFLSFNPPIYPAALPHNSNWKTVLRKLPYVQ